VQYQKLSAKRQGSLQFSSKCLYRLSVENRGRAGQIYQITRVDHQRRNAISIPQAPHLLALEGRELIWFPLARTGRENLKRIRAQPIGPLSRAMDPTCRRSMDTDPPWSRLGRLALRPEQNILHTQFSLHSPWPFAQDPPKKLRAINNPDSLAVAGETS
jgi:hypothetical protein